jgi:UDP:flavonoid glycosyltransferase YjiC (YdhE family)
VGDLRSVGVEGKTEFVGSFFDTSPAEVSEKHIFAPVSGPYGTRAKLLNMLLPAFEELGVKSIISLGVPGERKTAKKGNCTVHSWLTAQERAQAMRDASIVVFSGGHITCFETIRYAKPSICLPTQPEQLANAAKLRYLHCSLIAKNKAEIAAAVREIEANRQSYKTAIGSLNEFSNKFDGLSRAVEIIEETSH